MPRKKLTPKERAENKKASQAKWREKKKKSQDDQKNRERVNLNLVDEITPQKDPEITDHHLSIERETKKETNSKSEYGIKDYLGLMFPISLCISVTSLLIYFQAQAYSEDNSITPLNCAVSIICEISLLYLSGTLRRSFVSWFIFLSLFVYNLGVMTFHVKQKEVKKIALEIKNDPAEIMRQDTFEKALVSFDLSAKKRETGNTAKIIKILTDIRAEEPKEKPPMIQLYKIETFGLVILRAILMLFNALLVHRILNVKRVTIQPP